MRDETGYLDKGVLQGIHERRKVFDISQEFWKRFLIKIDEETNKNKHNEKIIKNDGIGE